MLPRPLSQWLLMLRLHRWREKLTIKISYFFSPIYLLTYLIILYSNSIVINHLAANWIGKLIHKKSVESIELTKLSPVHLFSILSFSPFWLLFDDRYESVHPPKKPRSPSMVMTLVFLNGKFLNMTVGNPIPWGCPEGCSIFFLKNDRNLNFWLFGA